LDIAAELDETIPPAAAEESSPANAEESAEGKPLDPLGLELVLLLAPHPTIIAATTITHSRTANREEPPRVPWFIKFSLNRDLTSSWGDTDNLEARPVCWRLPLPTRLFVDIVSTKVLALRFKRGKPS